MHPPHIRDTIAKLSPAVTETAATTLSWHCGTGTGTGVVDVQFLTAEKKRLRRSGGDFAGLTNSKKIMAALRVPTHTREGWEQ